MSRLFGALANAAAKYGEGRFKRKAYDDQQSQIDLENKRRAFEFSATQGRLTEQMNLVKQQRDDALQRQREGDVVDAQQSGYETAAPEAIGAAANAYLQSQGMGGPASAGVVRAPNTAPKKYELEGQTFGDDTQPGRQMQYATVGGRMMRYDPQRKINDETRKAFEGYTKELTMKRDVAQQNQAARDEAAKDRAITVEQIRAASRPQPQVPEDLFVDAEGNYNYVQRGRAVPRGWKPAANSMNPSQAKSGGGEGKALRAGLEDVTARIYAMGESGGIPEIGLPAAYAITKLTDPDASPLSKTAARSFMASLPEDQQAFGNLLGQLNSVVMPARGGKAITANEVGIVMGAAQPVPGESPEMRQQRMRAIFNVVGPLLASEDGDLEGAIQRVIERSKLYAPRAPSLTPEQQERFNRFRKP